MIRLFFVLIILAIGRLVYILEPFGISVDESTYLAVSEAWHRYGKLYVDAIDRKPPLLYGLYYVIGDLTSFWNVHAVHFVYFVFAFILCIFAEIVCRQICRANRMEISPWFAAILFAVISSTFSREFLSSNSEIALLLPLGISFILLLYLMPKPKMNGTVFFAVLFLASALAATATLLKQVACLPYAFAIIVWCLYLLFQRDYKKILNIVFAVTFGVCLVYGLTCYFFMQAGTFDDFVYWNLSDNFAYVKDSKLLQETSRPIFSPFFIPLLVWPALTAGLFHAYRSRRSLQFNFVWISFAAATLGALAIVYIGGRLYSHYFVPLAWFLSILAAPFVYALFKNPKYRLKISVALALPYAVCFLITTYRDELLPKASFDKTTQHKIFSISKVIQEKSDPGDRIVVWGMASQIYIASMRGSGTRFIPADYVSGRLAGFASSVKNPSPKALALYLKDFETKKPKLFVDTSTAKLNDYQYFPVKDYPELYSYLREHYEYLGTFEDFGLWKLKS